MLCTLLSPPSPPPSPLIDNLPSCNFILLVISGHNNTYPAHPSDPIPIYPSIYLSIYLSISSPLFPGGLVFCLLSSVSCLQAFCNYCACIQVQGLDLGLGLDGGTTTGLNKTNTMNKTSKTSYYTDNIANEGLPAVAQFRTMISPVGGMQSSLALVPMAGKLTRSPLSPPSCWLSHIYTL